MWLCNLPRHSLLSSSWPASAGATHQSLGARQTRERVSVCHLVIFPCLTIPRAKSPPATASLVWIQSTSLKHSNTSICHEVSLRISKGGGFCLPEKPCLHRFQTPHSPDFLPLSPQLLPFPKIDLPKALPSALCSLCDSLHIYILTFHFCTVNAPLHLGALISSDLGVSCPVRVSPYLPQSVFPEVNTLPFSSRPFFSSLPYNTPLFSHSLKLDF